jgi:hypothetical protein
MKKIYDATKAGCQFCKIHHARVLEALEKGNNIWKIALAEVDWWKFCVEDHAYPADDDKGSFSLSKDFGITYYSSDGVEYSQKLFVTKPISKQEAGTLAIL